MNRAHRSILWAAALVITTLLTASAVVAAPAGSSFTYQGRLEHQGVPVSDLCNFQFSLYDDASQGTLLGTVAVHEVSVADGLFSVVLDFGGGVFDGSARWLEISVQASTDPGFNLLSPRQAITPAPYAIYSLNVAGGGITLPYVADYSGPSSATMTANNWDPSGASGWAIFGRSQSSLGVFGQTLGNSSGVLGRAEGNGGEAVFGYAPNGAVGVRGIAEASDGLWGRTNCSGKSGVFGQTDAPGGYGVGGYSSQGTGVSGISGNLYQYGGYFANSAGGVALMADGKARVRVLEVLGADLVEKFEVKESPAGPGTVVVIDERNPGQLRVSDGPYDPRVAGVVSGANGITHGIQMGQGSSLDGDVPVALTGRVYAKCSAEGGVIRPGDLLTTSSTPGHAMKATDPARSNGAIIGKAMEPLESGTGLILVLVNLQ